MYLLTDRRPSLLPATGGNGLELAHSAAATASLLDDLRGDDGMGWVPSGAWLTKVRIDAAGGQLRYDLAIGASGADPSPVAAGLVAPAQGKIPLDVTGYGSLAIALAALAVHALRGRRGHTRPK